MQMRRRKAELGKHGFTTIVLVALPGTLLDHRAEDLISGVAVSVFGSRRPNEVKLHKVFAQHGLDRPEIPLAGVGALVHHAINRVVVAVTHQPRAMDQELLNCHVLQPPVGRRSIAPEKPRQSLAQPRCEADLAVTDQSSDAGARDRLRQACNHGGGHRIGADALGEHGPAVAAHHQDRVVRLMLGDPLIEHRAIAGNARQRVAGRCCRGIRLGKRVRGKRNESRQSGDRKRHGSPMNAKSHVPTECQISRHLAYPVDSKSDVSQWRSIGYGVTATPAWRKAYLIAHRR